jgi:predicted Zn-dependent protease with MMP-like domain
MNIENILNSEIPEKSKPEMFEIWASPPSLALAGSRRTAYFDAMNFETLSAWADEELKSLIKVLPKDIQEAAAKVAVGLEEKPGNGAFDDELDGDELGLFEGPSAIDEPDSGEMPRIRLFLANLWDWVDEDEHDFRDEVGTTFLHELGHYLGWDEDDVAARGLE